MILALVEVARNISTAAEEINNDGGNYSASFVSFRTLPREIIFHGVNFGIP